MISVEQWRRVDQGTRCRQHVSAPTGKLFNTKSRLVFFGSRTTRAPQRRAALLGCTCSAKLVERRRTPPHGKARTGRSPRAKGTPCSRPGTPHGNGRGHWPASRQSLSLARSTSSTLAPLVQCRSSARLDRPIERLLTDFEVIAFLLLPRFNRREKRQRRALQTQHAVR